MSVETRLAEHLANWGLREFSREQDYYVWQRESLSSRILSHLNELAEQRQGGVHVEADRDFYDLAASPEVLPVLHSQRFGYYQAVGKAIAKCLQAGESVLDFGCGAGILTTWYASMFPDCTFTGIDRSTQSIEAAQQYAQTMNVSNVSFHACSIPDQNISDIFDVIISTQALFQSETDPGLPSRSWESFERGNDHKQQVSYEARTGLGARLDWLCARLYPSGRFLAFEKTSHLGRRVLLQRAIEARGLFLDRDPVYLSYFSFGARVLDGPFYLLIRTPTSKGFDENPLFDPVDRVYRCQGNQADFIWGIYKELGFLDQPTVYRKQGVEIHWQVCRTASGLLCGRVLLPNLFSGVLMGMKEDEELLQTMIKELIDAHLCQKTIQQSLRDIWGVEEPSEVQLTPLYENHSCSAQSVWEQLSKQVVLREVTPENIEGQQYHVELGCCEGDLVYLYWANTLDQRQLVIMDSKRQQLLEEYFSESGAES